MIRKIKDWIQNKGLTVEEAFKCFDMNFDGYVTKDDLNKSL
jgi:Ca2+-binding EF-hand superfamily protein